MFTLSLPSRSFSLSRVAAAVAVVAAVVVAGPAAAMSDDDALLGTSVEPLAFHIPTDPVGVGHLELDDGIGATSVGDDRLMLASSGFVPSYALNTAGQTSSSRTLGLGLQVGSPTALTLKLAPPLSSGFAFGLGAGFGYGRNFTSSLWLHADYLFNLGTLLNGDGVRVGVYGGPGVFGTIFGSHYGFGYAGAPYYGYDAVGFGLRLPLGLAVVFDALPLELYGEFDPALGVFPGIGFGIGASLGFRIYL